MSDAESNNFPFPFLIFHGASRNILAEFATREEAETELKHWEDCEILEFDEHGLAS